VLQAIFFNILPVIVIIKEFLLEVFLGQGAKVFCCSWNYCAIGVGATVELTVNFENRSAEWVVPAVLKPGW
jgi:hypothetical protein